MATNKGREVVQTDNAPRAVGPYSQAVRTGQYVFTAGQVGIDPATGQMVEGDIAEQTRQVLRNVQAVLEASGSSVDRVVKTTVFLTTMDHFQSMNAVYAEVFGDDPPARSTVAVAGLPLGALVEIECVALVG